MRTIKLRLQIDDVNMVTEFREDEYKNLKEITGSDPVLWAMNKMWEEINKHDNIKDNQLHR